MPAGGSNSPTSSPLSLRAFSLFTSPPRRRAKSHKSSSTVSVDNEPIVEEETVTGSVMPKSPSSSWTAMDQLSVFARRASNLNLLNATGIQLSGSDSERAEQVMAGIVRTSQLGLNDASLGLYRVYEHIQRKVPGIIADKHQLKETSVNVDTACSDIEDAGKLVADLEHLESFHRMASMIKTSISIIEKSKS